MNHRRNSLNPLSPSHSSGPTLQGPGIFLILVFLFFAGCGTVQTARTPIMAVPVKSFPPVQPSLVRLPVDIIFPRAGDLLQHLTNFVKGGFKIVMPDLRGVPGLHMQSHIREIWDKMQEPIFLEKDTWLLIRPATIAVGLVRTDLKKESTLHTEMEMTAEPEIVFGTKPWVAYVKMPPLHHFIPGPGIFQAMSNTRISYKEATQYLLDPRLKLIGMVFPGSGDRKLTLEGFRISGSGGQVRVAVKLHYNPMVINFGGKPADLTLYLRGTPRYLPKQRMFDFPDLNYDIKSTDWVVQIADWLNKSEFTSELRRAVKIPIGPKLDVFKTKIDKVLNCNLSRFTHLNTQVDSLKVIGAFADDEGIEVRLSMQGKAFLELIWN
jgi:hypothetical protein